MTKRSPVCLTFGRKSKVNLIWSKTSVIIHENVYIFQLNVTYWNVSNWHQWQASQRRVTHRSLDTISSIYDFLHIMGRGSPIMYPFCERATTEIMLYPSPFLTCSKLHEHLKESIICFLGNIRSSTPWAHIVNWQYQKNLAGDRLCGALYFSNPLLMNTSSRNNYHQKSMINCKRVDTSVDLWLFL